MSFLRGAIGERLRRLYACWLDCATAMVGQKIVIVLSYSFYSMPFDLLNPLQKKAGEKRSRTEEREQFIDHKACCSDKVNKVPLSDASANC